MQLARALGLAFSIRATTFGKNPKERSPVQGFGAEGFV